MREPTSLLLVENSASPPALGGFYLTAVSADDLRNVSGR